MLTIRLVRLGAKNSPTYRLVVVQKHKDTKGDYIEKLGHYNPSANPKVINFNEERINYWVSVGAQPSSTVHNLLVSQGIIKGPKIKAFTIKKKEEEKKS